jgi:hypothetical protein
MDENYTLRCIKTKEIQIKVLRGMNIHGEAVIFTNN